MTRPPPRSRLVRSKQPCRPVPISAGVAFARTFIPWTVTRAISAQSSFSCTAPERPSSNVTAPRSHFVWLPGVFYSVAWVVYARCCPSGLRLRAEAPRETRVLPLR